mmetsp:Transcript_29393/g.41332  ORF Transcript_29393/g.41332 Transcript_29393/m.41332 type:complete len:287 (+) Transcript_29393:348-1208(+)
MPSLTPQHRSDEVGFSAFQEGILTMAMTMVPTAAGVHLAMKNSKKFVASTNWQSRTALVIMPPLFMFAFSSETKHRHRMLEVAHETEHSRKSAKWAEEVHQKTKKNSATPMSEADAEAQLSELYRKSVESSGVRVIPGNQLGPHHQFANYWQEYPFKILAFLGVPTVGYIFYGKSGQQHLQFQSMIMHTRVFGQFAVISMLLGLMGFKDYMDRNGKFITEAEADTRVEEMRAVREELMVRLNYDKRMKEIQNEEIHKAHEEDVKEGNVKKTKKKKKHVTNVEDIDA